MGLGQVVWHLRRQGAGEVARRAAGRLLATLDRGSPVLPVHDADIADSRRLDLTGPARTPGPDRPMTVGWLMTPPSLGSGGHTTVFRMIRSLEAAGHRCRVLLYDRYDGDPAAYAAVVREGWPWIKADVRSLDDGLDGLDACVATSWPTAHALASRSAAPIRRLYFVQDYEPYFYPHGSLYALAEDTYRFGFRTIALGNMVAQALKEHVGLSVDTVPFGCDTETYRLTGSGARNGVVLYAKPDVDRRGYLLARLALAEFHRRHPEQTIHVYGETARDLGIPAVRHERMTPTELNALYNRTVAGFAMSFTNISLVAEEMLAAGSIPVVNDASDARADLGNAFALWAAPTPGALADGLCAAVERPDRDVHALAAAQSVVGRSWLETSEDVVRIIEAEVYRDGSGAGGS
jgi:hypothetical protein